MPMILIFCSNNFPHTSLRLHYTSVHLYTLQFRLAHQKVTVSSFKPLFFGGGLCYVAFGILFPQPGIEPMPPAVEVQTLNHWPTMEVSLLKPLLIYSPLLCCFLFPLCYLLKNMDTLTYRISYNLNFVDDTFMVHFNIYPVPSFS